MPKPKNPLRQLAGSKGGHVSWDRTVDRTARTAKPRAALEQRFLDEAGGDPKRAENIRQAFYKDLALKSAKARRAKRGAA